MAFGLDKTLDPAVTVEIILSMNVSPVVYRASNTTKHCVYPPTDCQMSCHPIGSVNVTDHKRPRMMSCGIVSWVGPMERSVGPMMRESVSGVPNPSLVSV